MAIVLVAVMIFFIIKATEPCEQSKIPLYTFSAGEIATLKRTGEDVRVILELILLGGKCDRLYFAQYNVRFFSDGAEIEVDWSDLDKKPTRDTEDE